MKAEKQPRSLGSIRRIYDHGTVWALSGALREVVSCFPSQHVLDGCDDDDMSGARPAPPIRHMTIGEVRRWREVLMTYGIKLK